MAISLPTFLVKPPGPNHGRNVRTPQSSATGIIQDFIDPSNQVSLLPLIELDRLTNLFPSISLMIPPEIIALISSHALLSFSVYPRNSPTLLDIPSPFILTRYLDLCDVRPQNGPISQKPVLSAKQPIDDPFCARPNIADALQAAITTGIDPILDHPVNEHWQKHNPETGIPFGNRGFIPKTSLSLSVSMNIPASAAFHTSSLTPFSDMPKTKLHNLLSPANCTPKLIPPPSTRDRGHNALSFSTWVSESGHYASSPYSATSSPHFAIGNLLLSSCPGKKGTSRLHILIRQHHSFLIL